LKLVAEEKIESILRTLDVSQQLRMLPYW